MHLVEDGRFGGVVAEGDVLKLEERWRDLFGFGEPEGEGLDKYGELTRGRGEQT